MITVNRWLTLTNTWSLWKEREKFVKIIVKKIAKKIAKKIESEKCVKKIVKKLSERSPKKIAKQIAQKFAKKLKAELITVNRWLTLTNTWPNWKEREKRRLTNSHELISRFFFQEFFSVWSSIHFWFLEISIVQGLEIEDSKKMYCTAKMILQKTYFFSREYAILSRCKLYALLLFNHLVARRTLENKNENAVWMFSWGNSLFCVLEWCV